MIILLATHMLSLSLFLATWIPTASFFPDRHATMNGRRRHLLSSFEKPKWLEDAMGSDTSHSSSMPILINGLSGFCLDSELGFVAILAKDSKFVVTTVSYQDKGSDRLVSPEALTCVQLAGGLDLGTSILPPDILADMVVAEYADDDDDNTSKRPLVSLTGVKVARNKDYVEEQSRGSATEPNGSDIESNIERSDSIRKGLPQVFNAVKGLAGLQQVTLEQVEVAMETHANETGNLDRQGFSNILDLLRREMNSSPSDTSKLEFVLDVNVVREDSIQNISIETFDTFRALGLAMRHKITIQVDSECLEEDANIILEKFPAFRPMQELWEDAKVVEGFIPSTFEEAQRRQQIPPPF
jgi:hypothetical protein